MEERKCDCGFAIPEGAQFCPGCGKPLTRDARERERAANAFPVPREDESTTIDNVTFGTPEALRSCYWSAAIAAILCSLPLVSLLFFVIYPAAGFVSVASFRRKTGKDPTLRAGAKLGFMTGVLAFMLMLLLITFASVLPGSPGYHKAVSDLAQQLDDAGETDAATQLRELLERPGALAALMITMLAVFSILLIVLSTAGGLLGAKLLQTDGPKPA